MKDRQIIFSKTMLKTLVLTGIFILSTVFGPLFLQAKPVEAQVVTSPACKAMITDYAKWAQNSPNNVIDSQVSGLAIKNRDPNARLNSTYGRWGYARLYALGNALNGSYLEYFSDRMNGKDQRFYWKNSDSMSVNISPTSGVTLKLDSWGGTTFKLQNMLCSQDGFIVGRLGNSSTIITISLVKSYE